MRTGTVLSDERLQYVMTAVAASDDGDLVVVDRALAEAPDDPRLHFLRGSLLAGIGRPIEALASLRQAVDLAPDFAIARYQLGFFQLTSGEAADALSTWGPLTLLPEDHYLRIFVGGLTYLIRDEFPQALEQLRRGMAANRENAPLNRDIQLIIDRVGELAAEPGAGGDATSATSLLLGQFSSGRAH